MGVMKVLPPHTSTGHNVVCPGSRPELDAAICGGSEGVGQYSQSVGGVDVGFGKGTR